MDRLPRLAAAAQGSAILAASHALAIGAPDAAAIRSGLLPIASAGSGMSFADSGGRGMLLRVADLSLGETLKAAIAAGAANSYSQDAPARAAPRPAAQPPSPVASVPEPLIMSPAEPEAPKPAPAARHAEAETPRPAVEPRSLTAPAPAAEPTAKHHHPASETAKAVPAPAEWATTTSKPTSKPVASEPAAPKSVVTRSVASKPAAHESVERIAATPKTEPSATAMAERAAATPKPAPKPVISSATVSKPVVSKPAAPEPAVRATATAKPRSVEPAEVHRAAAAPARVGEAGVGALAPLSNDTLPSPPEDVADVAPPPSTETREGSSARAKKPTRVATLESGIPRGAGAEPALTLSFAPGSAALSQQSRETLERFANAFAARSGRLEITSYANSGDGTASAARRLSLKRALAVREVLLAQGVEPTRMDVRALGGSHGVTGDPNRLELAIEGQPSDLAASTGQSGGG
jgi:outer membrane protein OmpA-like peptidoglycan-associated protein